MQNKMSRASLTGIGLTCLVACAMLLWPLLGDPPYGFYAPMKWVVAFASGAAAWAAWRTSKALLALSVLLVASGAVELFGTMRRDEWLPFNIASLILLAFGSVVCFVGARSQRPSRPTSRHETPRD